MKQMFDWYQCRGFVSGLAEPRTLAAADIIVDGLDKLQTLLLEGNP